MEITFETQKARKTGHLPQLELTAPCGLQLSLLSEGTHILFNPAGRLLVPLRHTVRLQLAQCKLTIARGSFYFFAPSDRHHRSELEQKELQLVSDGPFLMLNASDVTWRVLQHLMKQLLIPGASNGTQDVARELLRWCQHLRKHAKRCLEPEDLRRFGLAVGLANSTHEVLIARCPGRAQAQREQVYLRLMRAKQSLQLLSDASQPVSKFAALASYSRGHFISIYRAVFGCTPYSDQLESRLHIAHHLLTHERRSVRDTTLASGFVDRTSFSKLFRQRFGITARAARMSA